MPKVAMDFSKTVIYHFVCKDTNIKCEYVGSTTNFSKRKAAHKADCNIETAKNHNCKVYQNIRQHGGWINWDMTPLEEFPCENKTQQVIREQYWIDRLKPEMNCVRAYISEEEKREHRKAYYEANKEMFTDNHKAYCETNKKYLREKQKVYCEANKQVIAEKHKVYYETNKDVFLKNRKEYCEAHKEAIKQYRSVKYTCECGSVFSINDKSRHERSKKHQAFIVPTA